MQEDRKDVRPRHTKLEFCLWVSERQAVMELIREIKGQLGAVDEKLEELGIALARAEVHVEQDGKSLEGLEQRMVLSREEIAALKVKASLFGLAAAALLEFLLLLAKHVKP